MTTSWFCAKTIGRETIATFYLARAGLEVFRPVIHKYFMDRNQREGMRVTSLIPGYVFVRLPKLSDQGAAMNASGVAYLLGSRDGGLFRPREMPSKWITDLINAGPVVQGKKMAFKKGDKVKRAIGHLAEIIGEVDGVDINGLITINYELLGSTRQARVRPEDLELVD